MSTLQGPFFFGGGVEECGDLPWNHHVGSNFEYVTFIDPV